MAALNEGEGIDQKFRSRPTKTCGSSSLVFFVDVFHFSPVILQTGENITPCLDPPPRDLTPIFAGKLVGRGEENLLLLSEVTENVQPSNSSILGTKNLRLTLAVHSTRVRVDRTRTKRVPRGPNLYINLYIAYSCQ
jgi:hypothetical protein